MTQIDVKALALAHAEVDAEFVTRMGLSVIKQWGALSTEVKALIRQQAIAVQIEKYPTMDQSGARLDEFLERGSGK